MSEDKSAQKFIAKFLEWVFQNDSDHMVYRGLADESQKAESSLHRRLRGKSKSAPKEEFIRASEELVKQAQLQGYARDPAGDLKDLQLMGRLQHYGAATCLIDFTKNPHVALWFACLPSKQKDGGADGKVIAVDISKYDTVPSNRLGDSLRKLMKEDHPWKWKPESLGNRDITQHSEFIFGQPEVESSEEITIPAALKADILKELVKIDILEERLFSDLYGFAQINAHDRPYRHYSESADYYATLAAQEAESNDHQGAIHWYGVAIMRDSTNSNWFKKRGDTKKEWGEYKSAIDDYNRVLEINPQDASAYHNRGYAKDELGDYKGAIDDYDRALEINPQDASAYYNRGIAKGQLNDYKGAIADYDRALEINPQDADAYYNRGHAKDESGDYKGAIADYDRVLEITPQDADAYRNRAITKKKSGDKEGAAADFQKAEELEKLKKK